MQNIAIRTPDEATYDWVMRLIKEAGIPLRPGMFKSGWHGGVVIHIEESGYWQGTRVMKHEITSIPEIVEYIKNWKPKKEPPFNQLKDGELVEFGEDGIHTATQHDGQFYSNPHITKDQIAQAHEYYFGIEQRPQFHLTPENITKLYREFVVKPKGKAWVDPSRFFIQGHEINLTKNDLHSLRELLERIEFNGVKK